MSQEIKIIDRWIMPERIERKLSLPELVVPVSKNFWELLAFSRVIDIEGAKRFVNLADVGNLPVLVNGKINEEGLEIMVRVRGREGVRKIEMFMPNKNKLLEMRKSVGEILADENEDLETNMIIAYNLARNLPELRKVRQAWIPRLVGLKKLAKVIESNDKVLIYFGEHSQEDDKLIGEIGPRRGFLNIKTNILVTDLAYRRGGVLLGELGQV